MNLTMNEGGARVVCASMTDGDVTAFLSHPNVMVSSDGGIGARHPRGAGTFPHYYFLSIPSKTSRRPSISWVTSSPRISMTSG